MSYNNFLSISGNTITIQNINTNDVWNITVIDANFMLSKYNGRGTDSVNIIPFPNIGDGIYGDIVLSVNNNPCFKGCISSSEGEGTYFNVSPKYITLHKKNDTYNINVSSDCTDLAISASTSLISVSEITNGISTVTSNTDEPFENNIVIVTNNCNGLQEVVYVSQKPSQDVSNMLTVNPQYITLSGEDKDFKINVISMCSGNTNYTYDETIEGLSLNKNGNIINGTVNSTEDITKTFTIKNDCYSKTVTVIYTKASENSHYMWIKEIDKTLVSGVTFDSVDDTFTYEIGSSSNWYIYSYDSSKVKCSKTVIDGNSNYIKITLGEDKSKCDDYEIILKNRDNDEVKVIYSIVDGLVSESGVTFTFKTGNTVHETGTITQNSSTDDITFDICVLCYDSDNNPVKWSVKSSTFTSTTTNLEGGVSGNCKTVTLKATDATKKSKSTNYTIKLQEQETFKELTVKVVIDRPESETNSSYHIEMYPEDGSTYSMSEMNDFQISVTPSYIYNGNTYYIGNNDAMSSNSSYKGVSAKTESKTPGVTLSLINESDVYDTLLYKVNITDTELESFEVCSTAYTKDDEATETTVCSTIFLTAHTVEVICDFTTGETSIEVSGEENTVEEYVMSRQDGDVVQLSFSGVEEWFSIEQDDFGESVFLKFKENTDFNERTAKVTIKQIDGCDNGEYIINIKQYSNQTIFIPDFDYIVVRYFWTSDAGADLDTVTVIPYLINNDGSHNIDEEKYPFLNKGVGWGSKHSFSVTGTNGVYIAHAGDNTQNGNECVYINFKNICSEEQIEDMLISGIRKIRVNLYGNWFRTKGTGMLDVSLITFKDGEMIEDPNDSFNFTNETGIMTYNETHQTKVCTQGSGTTRQENYDQGQGIGYTNIGYIEYDITNGNAFLTLHRECEDDQYTLSNELSVTSLTIPYIASSENSITFSSTKNGNYFGDVLLSSTQDWLSGFVTNSTYNPLKYTFSVTENTTENERLCKITVSQNESGNKIEYQIRQQVNTASFFSLNETEEVMQTEVTLAENQTTLNIEVWSCNNYSNGTGNRLGYTETHSCGTSGTINGIGNIKYEQTFTLPTTCTGGTIVLTQSITNKQITINFNRTCSCVSQETVNATVTLSSGEKYELNGSYYYNITATAILNKKIECGSATVTVYYGVGVIDNASFSEIVIPNNSNSGTVTNTLTIGVADEYDENFTMDCIHSSREGSVITFTNNSCYVAGVVNINVDSDSLCQECDCEVTNVSISPTSGTFLNEGDETIFNLKVETSTCDSCTKGYKLYDPNGRLVTAGTGENTVNITYATAINGEYKLVSDDNTGKTATLSIYKFSAYCLMDIAEKESADGNIKGSYSNSITINYPQNTQGVMKYISLRSRYYTSDSEYEKIPFTVSSDSAPWLTVTSTNNGNSFEYTVLSNNTYEERSGIITITQNGDKCSTKQVTMKILQASLPTSYQLATTSATIDHDDVEARVSIYSTRNGQPYNQLLFDESCAWLSAPYAQSSNNGTYVYQFTTTPNTGTTERSCTIKVSQENGTDTVNVTVTQKGAPTPPPTPTNCMNVKYITKGLTEPVTVLFKTTNGTQQGGGHSVSNDSTKELCCTGLDGTNLIASCMDETITVGGQKEFTYNSGSTITINLTKPHISELKIQNNENGAAKITMYDGTHTNIIPITDNFGTPHQTVTLSNRGDEQSFGAIFTEERIIDVVYESNQWCSSDSCFVYVTFEGEGITMRKGAQNSVVIHEDFAEGFKIVGSSGGSCSGSVICEVNGYQVIVNLIFKDYPSSSNPI